MKRILIYMLKIIVGFLIAFLYLKLMFYFHLIEIEATLFGDWKTESIELIPFAFITFPTALILISVKNRKFRIIGITLALLIVFITGLQIYNEKLEIKNEITWHSEINKISLF